MPSDGDMLFQGFHRQAGQLAGLHDRTFGQDAVPLCYAVYQAKILFDQQDRGAGAATARRWTRTLDPSADHAIAPGSPFVQAVDALGCAARACRLRLEMTASPWELAVALTGLLHGRPRDPPEF